MLNLGLVIIRISLISMTEICCQSHYSEHYSFPIGNVLLSFGFSFLEIFVKIFTI